MRGLPDLEVMLSTLVATPSTSSSDPALDVSNRAIAEILGGWLHDAGFSVDFRDIPGWPGKMNVLGRLGPETAGGLVLAGHLDTVPVAELGWRDDPFRLRREGDDFIGLGIADMKAFFAVALRAVARFPAAGLREPVWILGTADEESSMCGGAALVEDNRLRARHAVIGEPTGLRPVRAHKGVLFEAIRVHGRAGHSSNPALGLNALDGMHRVMQALMDLRAELAREWHDPVFEVPAPTLNFGRLAGGDAPNRIADAAELQVDLRTLPGMPLAAFRETIRERAAAALAGSAYSLHFEALFEGLGSLDTPPDAPVVRELEAQTGHEAGSVAFSTEGPYLRQLGMDVAIFGPGDIDQAHQPEERVSALALARCEEHLASLIRKFCT